VPVVGYFHYREALALAMLKTAPYTDVAEDRRMKTLQALSIIRTP